MINRRVFFDEVRRSGVVGKRLTQYTVDSLEAILDGFEALYPRASLPQIAYVMATARHEAWDARKQSIRYDIEEFGGKARSYGKTGFYGRGLSQITHEENYKRAGDALLINLAANPALALRKDVSAKILILGSMLGWFRGDEHGRHSLPRYFNAKTTDPVGAREIINADRSKNGGAVAAHYSRFLSALKASSTAVEERPPMPPPVIPTMPTPAPVVVPPDTHAALPWYKSQVIWGLIISVVFKGISLLAPKYYPAIAGYEGQVVTWAASFIGDAIATYGRLASNAQPVKWSQDGADQVTKERTIAADVAAATVAAMPIPAAPVAPDSGGPLVMIDDDPPAPPELSIVELLQRLERDLPEFGRSLKSIQEIAASFSPPAALARMPPVSPPSVPPRA